MKKWLSVLLCIFLLCVTLGISAFAHPDRLVDDADLLTSVEESVIREQLDQISQTYNMDVVIVTVPDIGNTSVVAYADDYFDYNGYGLGDSGQDGVLLLINMAGRDWYISTCGAGIEAFDDSTIDTIGESIVEYLSVENYAQAFQTFSDECNYYIDGYVNGFPFSFGTNLLISLAIGFVIALIATGVMKGQLKSVHKQSAASEYVRQNSLNITQSNEIFLYRNVTRVRKETESSGSSTHTSSSGRSHGGGGGKF